MPAAPGMRELPRLRTTPEPGQIEPVNLADGLHTHGLKFDVVLRDGARSGQSLSGRAARDAG